MFTPVSRCFVLVYISFFQSRNHLVVVCLAALVVQIALRYSMIQTRTPTYMRSIACFPSLGHACQLLPGPIFGIIHPKMVGSYSSVRFTRNRRQSIRLSPHLDILSKVIDSRT